MNWTWQDIENLLTRYEDREGAEELVGDLRDALWGLPEAGEYRRIRMEGEG